jgi:K+-sensing histidine kinase KdpD
MAFDFEKLLKRYVWDDDKTPYFTPSHKLNQRQATYEAIAYTIFCVVLFSVVALATLTGAGGHERASGPAVMCFTFISAAVIFGFTKNYYSAMWLSTAPVATVAYFFIYGFKPGWHASDQVVVLSFVALWTLYSIRIVSIGRRYEDMPLNRPDEQ